MNTRDNFIILSATIVGLYVISLFYATVIEEHRKEIKELKNKIEKIEKNQLQSPTSVVD